MLCTVTSTSDLHASPAEDADATPPPLGPWTIVKRVLALVGFGLFAAFWVWALFFASKEAVNKIDDRAWAERAEQICDEAEVALTVVDAQTSDDLEVRADLVVESTDILSTMLDDIEAVGPTDEKGQAIVPDWLADYRTLLDDRYAYAEQLRSGEDGPFRETAVNDIPITERIETFAGDNEMPSCAPPRGSVI